MKRIAVASAFFALVLLAMPATSFAASKPTFFGPIVPPECHCDNKTNPAGGANISTAPDYGCVLMTTQNAVNFGVTIAIMLFVIYLVFAGFTFLISGGSSESLSKAKTRLLNVMIGLAVLLLSWLIVDYIMKTVYDPTTFFGPWNSILAGKTDNSDRCVVVTTPSAITTGTIGIITGAPGTIGATTAAGAGTHGNSGLDVGKATSYLISHYGGKTTSGHMCLSAIQLALGASGGGSLACPGQGTSHYAGTCGPLLISKGYAALGSSDGSPQVGDIIVVPSNPASAIGHIAMYTSSGWISDYAQGANGNPYASQPPAQYYRP